jgi:hypothetical protein
MHLIGRASRMIAFAVSMMVIMELLGRVSKNWSGFYETFPAKIYR